MLFVGQRLLFVLRRPELVRGGADALRAFAFGALGDLLLALAAGGLVSLVGRGSPRRSAVAGAMLATLLSLMAAVETEYFAFSRNRFDATFVAYVREWRTLAGSASGETSPLFLALHALLAALAAAVLVRWRRQAAEGTLPTSALRLVLGGSALAVWTSLPLPAATWYGLELRKVPLVGLLRALRPPPPRVVDAGSAGAGALRAFTNPWSSKCFTDDVHPMTHTGGRAPTGAFGAVPERLNVLFVMLEGMEASHLAAMGSSEGLTPELDRLAANGLVYRRFFANGAHTPRAMEASLCGLAPRLVGAPVSRAQPRMPLACLPGLLRDRGFETAFVHGGFEAFENRLEFLGRVGFRDTLFWDQFGKHHPTANGGWGGTDAQTYDRALQWLDARDGGRPFFLTVLSISNHHPFHVPDPGLEFDHDETRLSRNTVRYADREVGRFAEGLRQRGLLDSTVVFLFGDHGLTRSNLGGEPAAQTAQRMLVRANVPLVVLAPPGLFPHGVNDRLASQNDLLPTVLDLLGADAPTHAMGHSLGWTWHDGGRDLPVLVHDVYSQLAATVRPDRLEIAPVDAEARVDGAGSWRWSASPGGLPEVSRIESDAAEAGRLRAVLGEVDGLYRTERWWSPGPMSQTR
ncbi:MAG: hypothetical protein RL199_612 [Pseudomonadota bacterium]|jgi:phosphoglycerol transferase MdoB-like AlkP superfamily enzyme